MGVESQYLIRGFTPTLTLPLEGEGIFFLKL